MACCDNCGDALQKYGAECGKCGFKPQPREFKTPLLLVFCRTCGCVYEGGCSKGHETSPYKPGA